MIRATRRARRGVAMLAALWLVVGISVVALEFSLAGRERRDAGQQRRAATEPAVTVESCSDT